MVLVISWGLVGITSVLTILVAVFLIEIAAAVILPSRRASTSASGQVARQSVAALVPAHNESIGIAATVDGIKAQLIAGDRLVVVADNCSDDTASVATAAGAEVIVRNDLTKIGKGFALAFGLEHLRADPPQVVVMIDADCRPSEGTIDRLARLSAATNRPVQALDLMVSPADPPINFRVAEFAWRVRNWVRPLGVSLLGVPCRLMGTGMAFPWAVVRSVEFASAELAEDQKLGSDLTIAGHAPLFCVDAIVTSKFPTSVEGAKTQRQRWEHGHLGLIVTLVPRLLGQAIIRRHAGLLGLAIDLAIPPLALLGLLLTGALLASGVAALMGFSTTPFIISAASLVAFALGVLLCWVTHGRDLLPPAALLSVVPYVLGKLGLYGRFLLRKRASRWIRTDRG